MPSPTRELATLAGGCFWCLEAVFPEMRGVHGVRSGYAGGDVPNPTYEHVCTGKTGHAEAVQVEFDPDVITYRDLLNVFFTIHDPTTLNRQGADIGSQYRSAIFYHSPAQRTDAEKTIAELNAAKLWNHEILTAVSPLDEFFPAEAEHDDYYRRNANKPYCQLIIAPKVLKARQKFVDKLKS